MTAPADLSAKLERIRIFLCDVDGVLTDGAVIMGHGPESKQFHIPDGLGLRLLQRHGILVGWISNRPSPATSLRAQDLKVDFLHQESGSKVVAVQQILEQARLPWESACYLGDDIVDLGVLKRVGTPVAVANAIAEVKSLAAYITQQAGGRGAVREVVELILKAQNKWADLIQEYSH